MPMQSVVCQVQSLASYVNNSRSSESAEELRADWIPAQRASIILKLGRRVGVAFKSYRSGEEKSPEIMISNHNKLNKQQ